MRCGQACGPYTNRAIIRQVAQRYRQLNTNEALAEGTAQTLDHLSCVDCFPEPWYDLEALTLARELKP